MLIFVVVGILSAFLMVFLLGRKSPNKKLPIESLPERSRKGFWLLLIGLLLVGAQWMTLYCYPQFWHTVLVSKETYSIVFHITSVLLFAASYGVMATIVNTVLARLIASTGNDQVLGIIMPLTKVAEVALLLVILNGILNFLKILPLWEPAIHQFNQIVVIVTIGWFLFQCIEMSEAIFIQQRRKGKQDNLKSRRAYTYVAVIKRIVIVMLITGVVGAILTRFDRIRATGNAILASAGVLATIVGLSARGLLESIFKGLQLIITQPIRLDDTVTIYGETGVITDITLSHVVMTLADQSQVIIPTGDFLQKSFKNWTHRSANLMDNVTFYVNYNMPIETIREKMQIWLKESNCEDCEMGELIVSDFKNNLVELQLILSSKNGKQLATLRHELKEKLLKYMQSYHADGLPK